MKRLWMVLKKLALAGLVLAGSNAFAQAELTGDAKNACGAIMCLSTSTRPGACTPYLERYFSITARTFTTTINKRKDFLHLCPSSSQSPQMSAQVDAIANGAGRCDPDSLNTELQVSHSEGAYDAPYTWTTVSSSLPGYCTSYLTMPFNDLGGVAIKYLGTEDTGGYWVYAKDYAVDLAQWNSVDHPVLGPPPPAPDDPSQH